MPQTEQDIAWAHALVKKLVMAFELSAEDAGTVMRDLKASCPSTAPDAAASPPSPSPLPSPPPPPPLPLSFSPGFDVPSSLTQLLKRCFVAKRVAYDSRARALMRRLCEALRTPWSRFVCAEEALRGQLLAFAGRPLPSTSQRPESGAAPPPPPASTAVVSVVCPANVRPGMKLRVNTSGGPVIVTVPMGVRPGTAFKVRLPPSWTLSGRGPTSKGRHHRRGPGGSLAGRVQKKRFLQRFLHDMEQAVLSVTGNSAPPPPQQHHLSRASSRQQQQHQKRPAAPVPPARNLSLDAEKLLWKSFNQTCGKLGTSVDFSHCSGGNGVTAVIAVSGGFDRRAQFDQAWGAAQYPHLHKYALVWEEPLLRDLGATLAFMYDAGDKDDNGKSHVGPGRDASTAAAAAASGASASSKADEAGDGESGPSEKKSAQEGKAHQVVEKSANDGKGEKTRKVRQALEEPAALHKLWALACAHAKEAATVLADLLRREAARGLPPVTLVGDCFGALVIFLALENLESSNGKSSGTAEARTGTSGSQLGAAGAAAPGSSTATSAASNAPPSSSSAGSLGGRRPTPPPRSDSDERASGSGKEVKVQDVVLLGLPVAATPDRWRCVRRAVAGRLISGFSRRDLVLERMSRTYTYEEEEAGKRDGAGVAAAPDADAAETNPATTGHAAAVGAGTDAAPAMAAVVGGIGAVPVRGVDNLDLSPLVDQVLDYARLGLIRHIFALLDLGAAKLVGGYDRDDGASGPAAASSPATLVASRIAAQMEEAADSDFESAMRRLLGRDVNVRHCRTTTTDGDDDWSSCHSEQSTTEPDGGATPRVSTRGRRRSGGAKDTAGAGAGASSSTLSGSRSPIIKMLDVRGSGGSSGNDDGVLVHVAQRGFRLGQPVVRRTKKKSARQQAKAKKTPNMFATIHEDAQTSSASITGAANKAMSSARTTSTVATSSLSSSPTSRMRRSHQTKASKPLGEVQSSTTSDENPASGSLRHGDRPYGGVGDTVTGGGRRKEGGALRVNATERALALSTDSEWDVLTDENGRMSALSASEGMSDDIDRDSCYAVSLSSSSSSLVLVEAEASKALS